MSAHRCHRLAPVLLAALALAAGAAFADDRQLLRTGTGDPLVFILLDTSGSMNWSSQCTAEDMTTLYDDDGDDPTCEEPDTTPCVPVCNYRCDSGDCPTPRNADDPAAKFRQAKEALYQVLQEVDGVSFGFATYNQDQLRVNDKHWLYQVDATQPEGFFTLAGGQAFPAPGSQEVLGATLTCDRACPGSDEADGSRANCNGTNRIWDDWEVGCYGDADAADVTDAWELEKVRRLPKLGRAFGDTVTFYIQSAGTRYRVRYLPNGASAPPPANVTIDVELERCNNLACTSRTLIDTKTIAFSPIGDFVFWDYQVRRDPQEGGWFGASFSSAGETCRGWDPSAQPVTGYYVDRDGILDNSNLDVDPSGGYSLKRPTTNGPYQPGNANDWRFWEGDVVPPSWLSNNETKARNRLAPGASNPAMSNPFGQADYFNDRRQGADTFLRLDSALGTDPPLIANGSTPIAGSLSFFRHWYSGCGKPGNCNDTSGWNDIAAVNDPDWECRKKYLLILTDGAETCDNAPGSADYYRNNWSKFPPGFDERANPDACAFVASMQSQEDIQSIVIAFGVTQNNPKINCLSSRSQPYYVQTKGALVRLLRELFGQIIEETAAFASAAVPTVQANIADKVYLSSFTPLNRESVWPGRLDAFLKPLPLDANNLPNRAIRCQAGSLEAECFAWDAGDSQPAWEGETGYAPEGMLLQAPDFGDVVAGDNTTLKIGMGSDERRVFFGLPESTVPGKRQWFRFPADAAEQLSYEYIWNLPPPLGSPGNRAIINSVVEFTLEEKQGLVDNPADPDNPFHIQYVMGDVFHSNPLVLNPPSNFELYTKDLYWNAGLCGLDPGAPTQNSRGSKISYDWYSNRNLCRRVMLLVGSNDGQLHVFDGGVFRGGDCKLNLPVDTNGAFRNDNSLADDDGLTGKYDFGSGREIFSFIPSALMPLVKELSEVDELTSQYGVDGTPRVADVFIDPQLDALGLPECTEREWRTVVFGSYREGGPGFFALDITQPDVIDSTGVPDPATGSPRYVPSCTNGGAGCGPVPFPSLLWEFSDDSDEDANLVPDLAESWSRPVIARVQVCDGACDSPGEPEDRWVAIFGGGLSDSPYNSSADATGNWLYMIDVETGGILYKRGGEGRIVGSVASDVTVVDANSNGLVDTLYFPTTAGFVYKLDLGEGPFRLDVNGRIEDPTGETGRYDPFQVFSTGGRPIYLEISAVFVPQLRANALLFGTGSRWNLWEFNNVDGRFYALADTGWADTNRDGMVDAVGCGTCTQPLTEASFEPIDPDAAFSLTSPGPNYLFANPNSAKLPGWYFTLDPNEKLITEAFSLSGVTFFTVYAPIHTEEDNVCALGGESKIFTVNTVNASGYALAAGATDYTRYVTAPRFTTQPFIEQSATGNQGTGTGNNADTWTDELRQINAELKKLFPAACRFANYTLDIKTIRSDTGIVFVAPVPICIEGHNWKEY